MSEQAKLYVASKASIPSMPDMWQALRSSGWNIISTWIDGAGPGDPDLPRLWERILWEIKVADGLILYTTGKEHLKGALIEAGMALMSGIPVAVVNPMAVSSLKDTQEYVELGSWINHPGVRCFRSLIEARRWIEGSYQIKSLEERKKQAIRGT